MNTGYGICGHKNSFNSGVKIGNYVEDRIGGDLARTSRPRALSGATEVNANFVDPKDMPDKCAHAPKENLVDRTLLRAGLPYNLIFEHGVAHTPTAAELQTKYVPTSCEVGGGLNTPVQTTQQQSLRMKELEIKRTRQAREQKHGYVTSTQAIVPATFRRK
ncbi:TPA: hypothetical protein N0F65_000407 [Lagenidium giganteum]|uniref:Uncharacterized protein n=1 Tax=Lagenidium giganteum TaxID=4803 RepID=A0AAV2YYM4_9STRA|nr:TPA: hypothetical protein N0F65_000407 [Lagenidium giganteum]